MTQKETEDFRKEFVQVLEPFLEMMKSQKQNLNSKDWIAMVYRTQSSITLNPDQYLGQELPSMRVINKLVEEIFNDFVQAQTPVPAEPVSVF